MAFNINAQVILDGPKNITKVRSKIRNSLKGIKVPVQIDIPKGLAAQTRQLATQIQNIQTSVNKLNTSAKTATTSLNNMAKAANSLGTNTAKVNTQSKTTAQNINNVGKQAQFAGGAMAQFGKDSALAIRRFAAFSIATGAVFGFIRAVQQATGESIKFQRELIKITQVTGKGGSDLNGLRKTIDQLSTSLGISANELLNVARTFAQTGQSLTQIQSSLRAVAKASLAPTFDSMADSAEGLIAALNQFDIAANRSEAILGSLNQVSKRFAVEASDLISVIRRAGGVFAASTKQLGAPEERLRELIGVFTAVRATTRESADTIATGLRTIFSRIQRPKTIDFLQQLGVELRATAADAKALGIAQGDFVGIFEALKRVSGVIDSLDTLTLAQVVEELGGIRQVGKLIPALRNFQKAEAARGEALKGTVGLSKDVALATQTLSVRIEQTQQRFQKFIRTIAESRTFQTIAKSILTVADSLIAVGEALTPLLPAIATLGTFKLGQLGVGFARGFAGSFRAGGGVQATGQALGGAVTGSGASAAASQANTASMKSLIAATNANAKAVALNTTALGNNTSAIARLTGLIPALTRSLQIAGATSSAARSRALLPRPIRRARGGIVPGVGNGDTVPALLEPGEFVIRKSSVKKLGAGSLQQLNQNKFQPGTPLRGVPKPPKAGTFAAFTAGNEREFQFEQAKKLGLAKGATLRNLGDVDGSADFDIGAAFLLPTGIKRRLRAGIPGEQLVQAVASKIGTTNLEGVKKLGRFPEADLQVDIQGGSTTRKASRQFRVGLRKSIEGISRQFNTTNGLPFNQSKFKAGYRKANPEQIEGNALEAALVAGTDRPFDESRDAANATFDFRRGLGVAIGNLLGISPRIPSDAKRTFNQDSIGSLVKKAGNLFVDNKTFQVAVRNLLQEDQIKSDIQSQQAVALGTTKRDLVKRRRELSKTEAGRSRLAALGIATKASGGGIGGSDTVPALLTPGEFVINKQSAQSIGYSNLNSMNKRGVAKFNKGGAVGFQKVQKLQAGGFGRATNVAFAASNLAFLDFSEETGNATSNLITLATTAFFLSDELKALGGVVAKSNINFAKFSAFLGGPLKKLTADVTRGSRNAAFARSGAQGPSLAGPRGVGAALRLNKASVAAIAATLIGDLVVEGVVKGTVGARKRLEGVREAGFTAEQGGATTAGLAGGAKGLIGGAATGFLIAGPIGAAVGAVAGAITGFVNALNEQAIFEAFNNVATAASNVAESFNRVGQNFSDIFNLQRLNTDITALESSTSGAAEAITDLRDSTISFGNLGRVILDAVGVATQGRRQTRELQAQSQVFQQIPDEVFTQANNAFSGLTDVIVAGLDDQQLAAVAASGSYADLNNALLGAGDQSDLFKEQVKALGNVISTIELGKLRDSFLELDKLATALSGNSFFNLILRGGEQTDPTRIAQAAQVGLQSFRAGRQSGQSFEQSANRARRQFADQFIDVVGIDLGSNFEEINNLFRQALTGDAIALNRITQVAEESGTTFGTLSAIVDEFNKGIGESQLPLIQAAAKARELENASRRAARELDTFVTSIAKFSANIGEAFDELETRGDIVKQNIANIFGEQQTLFAGPQRQGVPELNRFFGSVLPKAQEEQLAALNNLSENIPEAVRQAIEQSDQARQAGQDLGDQDVIDAVISGLGGGKLPAVVTEQIRTNFEKILNTASSNRQSNIDPNVSLADQLEQIFASGDFSSILEGVSQQSQKTFDELSKATSRYVAILNQAASIQVEINRGRRAARLRVAGLRNQFDFSAGGQFNDPLQAASANLQRTLQAQLGAGVSTAPQDLLNRRQDLENKLAQNRKKQEDATGKALQDLKDTEVKLIDQLDGTKAALETLSADTSRLEAVNKKIAAIENSKLTKEQRLQAFASRFADARGVREQRQVLRELLQPISSFQRIQQGQGNQRDLAQVLANFETVSDAFGFSPQQAAQQRNQLQNIGGRFFGNLFGQLGLTRNAGVGQQLGANLFDTRKLVQQQNDLRALGQNLLDNQEQLIKDNFAITAAAAKKQQEDYRTEIAATNKTIEDLFTKLRQDFEAATAAAEQRRQEREQKQKQTAEAERKAAAEEEKKQFTERAKQLPEVFDLFLSGGGGNLLKKQVPGATPGERLEQFSILPVQRQNQILSALEAQIRASQAGPTGEGGLRSAFDDLVRGSFGGLDPNLFERNLEDFLNNVRREAIGEDSVAAQQRKQNNERLKNLNDTLGETKSSIDALKAAIEVGDPTGFTPVTPPGRNNGGIVRGRGGIDQNLIRISSGEFVMRKQAVDQFGVGFMNSVNQGVIPEGFQDGGSAFRTSSATSVIAIDSRTTQGLGRVLENASQGVQDFYTSVLNAAGVFGEFFFSKQGSDASGPTSFLQKELNTIGKTDFTGTKQATKALQGLQGPIKALEKAFVDGQISQEQYTEELQNLENDFLNRLPTGMGPRFSGSALRNSPYGNLGLDQFSPEAGIAARDQEVRRIADEKAKQRLIEQSDRRQRREDRQKFEEEILVTQSDGTQISQAELRKQAQGFATSTLPVRLSEPDKFGPQVLTDDQLAEEKRKLDLLGATNDRFFVGGPDNLNFDQERQTTRAQNRLRDVNREIRARQNKAQDFSAGATFTFDEEGKASRVPRDFVGPTQAKGISELSNKELEAVIALQKQEKQGPQGSARVSELLRSVDATIQSAKKASARPADLSGGVFNIQDDINKVKAAPKSALENIPPVLTGQDAVAAQKLLSATADPSGVADVAGGLPDPVAVGADPNLLVPVVAGPRGQGRRVRGPRFPNVVKGSRSAAAVQRRKFGIPPNASRQASAVQRRAFGIGNASRQASAVVDRLGFDPAGGRIQPFNPAAAANAAGAGLPAGQVNRQSNTPAGRQAAAAQQVPNLDTKDFVNAVNTFNTEIKTFNTAATDLAAAIRGGLTVKMDGTQNVNVNLNGGGLLDILNQATIDTIAEKVKAKIQESGTTTNPDGSTPDPSLTAGDGT